MSIAGLEKIKEISRAGNTGLGLFCSNTFEYFSVKYKRFDVGDEEDYYRLTIGNNNNSGM